MFKIIIFLNLFFLLLHSESIYSNDNCTVDDVTAAKKALGFLNDNANKFPEKNLNFVNNNKDFLKNLEKMAKVNRLDDFSEVCIKEPTDCKRKFDLIDELEKIIDPNELDRYFLGKTGFCKSNAFNPDKCEKFFGQWTAKKSQNCSKKSGFYTCISSALNRARENRKNIDPSDHDLYDFLLESEMKNVLPNITKSNRGNDLPSFELRFRQTKSDLESFNPNGNYPWATYDNDQGNFSNKLLPELRGNATYEKFDIGVLPSSSNTTRNGTRLFYNSRDKTVWVTGDHYRSARFVGCKPNDCTESTIEALRIQCRQLRCEVP